MSRSLYCRGVFGQMIYVNFAHRLVGVKLSTWPDFLNPTFSIATQDAFHAIAEALR